MEFGNLVHFRRLQPEHPTQGTIGTNFGRTFASITDGLSNTILSAEVKTYLPVYHDCSSVPGGAPTGPNAYPDIATVLASVAASASSGGCKLAAGSGGLAGGGHTRWCNGKLVL